MICAYLRSPNLRIYCVRLQKTGQLFVLEGVADGDDVCASRQIPTGRNAVEKMQISRNQGVTFSAMRFGRRPAVGTRSGVCM